MSECAAVDEMCPITRGDTAPFLFEFIGLDDEPLDLTDMALHFIMKKDPAQEVPDLHHVLRFNDKTINEIDPILHSSLYNAQEDVYSKIAIIDPASRKRKFIYDYATGKGAMKILPRETLKLRAGQCYFFAFKLVGGPEDIYTVGSGKITVNSDLAPVAVPL